MDINQPSDSSSNISSNSSLAQETRDKAYRKILGKWVFICVAIGLVIFGIVYFIFFRSSPNQYSSTGAQTPNATAQSQAGTNAQNPNTPPLLLKSIGVNLDYYDPKTGKAGDFMFTKEKLQFNSLFMGYGFFIPASSASSDKKNPQPTYILPLGTPVRSLVDGVVANMPKLWSGDISIQVTTDGKLQRWVMK